MKSLNGLLVIIALLFSIGVSAQTISFEYDDAGNRISRDVIYLKTTEVDSSDNRQADVFKEMLGETKVTISPNPNGGRFTVKIEGYDVENPPQVYLHSISGIMIYEDRNAVTLTNIDISSRENGTYILSLIIGTERKTWKIIKQ